MHSRRAVYWCGRAGGSGRGSWCWEWGCQGAMGHAMGRWGGSGLCGSWAGASQEKAGWEVQQWSPVAAFGIHRQCNSSIFWSLCDLPLLMAASWAAVLFELSETTHLHFSWVLLPIQDPEIVARSIIPSSGSFRICQQHTSFAPAEGRSCREKWVWIFTFSLSLTSDQRCLILR